MLTTCRVNMSESKTSALKLNSYRRCKKVNFSSGIDYSPLKAVSQVEAMREGDLRLSLGNGNFITGRK